jgi:hypothetical protein
MRIGPRMRQIIAYVASNPGCTKMAAAYSLIYHGRTSNRFGYAAVDRALATGLILQRERPEKRRHFRLYPTN